METSQDFWESLQQKYVDKNQALQKQETELKYKLEALQAVVGDVPKAVEKSPPVTKSSGFSQSLPPQIGTHVSETMTQLTVPTLISGQASVDKSCVCSPESEKTCFLKNCLALLPPWKNKNESPPSDTKKEEKPELKNLPIKNENCMCNPCQVEISPVQQQKDDFNCHCSICSKLSDAKSLCCCDIELLTEGEILHPTKSARGKDDGPILTPTQKKSAFPVSPSKLSLKSADLHYMKNIHELATKQKAYLKSINEMEQKARIFEEIFNEYKNLDFSPKQSQVREDTSKTAANKNAELKIENFLLKNELKEMRLEVRQYIERMEGPILFKIESEKYKNAQLEQKIEQAAQELAKTQELYEKEINSLKMQLCTAQSNMYNLTESNKKLTEDLQTTKSKCCQLNEELVRQKISEAETLKTMQQCLKTQQPPVKEECNLHQIARDLSKILKECEPCGECVNLPGDLTAAARMLKSLTDMIDQKIPKEADVCKQDSNCTCTESTDEYRQQAKSVEQPGKIATSSLEYKQSEKDVCKQDSNCTCTDATDECRQQAKSVEQPEKIAASSLDYKQGEKDVCKQDSNCTCTEANDTCLQQAKEKRIEDENELLPSKDSEKSAKTSIATFISEEVKSEKLKSVNNEERTEISSNKASLATFEDGPQSRKPSCVCPSTCSSPCPSPAIEEKRSTTREEIGSIGLKTRSESCVCAKCQKTVTEKDTTKSEKPESVNIEERTEISSKKASVATFEDGTQSRKPSCICPSTCPSPAIKEKGSTVRAEIGSIKSQTRNESCVCAKCQKTVTEKDTTKSEKPESVIIEERTEISSKKASVATFEDGTQSRKPSCVCASACPSTCPSPGPSPAIKEKGSPTREEIGSIKSQTQNASCICAKCQKTVTEKDTTKSEKPESVITEERTEISSKKASVATFEDGIQSRKPSCVCPSTCPSSCPSPGPSPAFKEKRSTTREEMGSVGSQTRNKSCKCAKPQKTVTEKDTTKSCKCATKEIKEFVPAAFEGSSPKKPPGKTDLAVAKSDEPPVNLLWPKDSEKLMVSHQVTASKSQELVKSQTAVKAFNVKENFPFNVDTHVDIIDKKPDGVHVTTTITDSGMLEVVTEGPEGFIETTLIYTKSGNVEVVTEILEYQAKGKKSYNRGSLKATSTCVKGIEPAPSGLKALPSSEVTTTLLESQSRVKPNCKCEPSCAALKGFQKGDSEVGKRSVKESEKGMISSKVELPESCRCTVCPETEPRKDSNINAEVKASSASEKLSKGLLLLPSDCKCLSCPQDAGEDINAEVKASSASEKSSKGLFLLPSDCKCLSCPQDAGKVETLEESSSKVQENISQASSPSNRGGCKCRKCL